jgi:hypothetical protein
VNRRRIFEETLNTKGIDTGGSGQGLCEKGANICAEIGNGVGLVGSSLPDTETASSRMLLYQLEISSMDTGGRTALHTALYT